MYLKQTGQKHPKCSNCEYLYVSKKVMVAKKGYALSMVGRRGRYPKFLVA